MLTVEFQCANVVRNGRNKEKLFSFQGKWNSFDKHCDTHLANASIRKREFLSRSNLRGNKNMNNERREKVRARGWCHDSYQTISFFPFRSKYERISRQIFSHKSAYEFLISLCALWSWETRRNSMKNEHRTCQFSLQNENRKERWNDRIQFVNNCSLVRFDLDPSSSINSLMEQHLLKNYVISNSFIFHARAGKKWEISFGGNWTCIKVRGKR